MMLFFLLVFGWDLFQLPLKIYLRIVKYIRGEKQLLYTGSKGEIKNGKHCKPNEKARRKEK